MSEKRFKEQRFAAFIRKVIIAFLDVTLLISSNYLACYITMDGTVLHSSYSSIAMSAWHIVILAFICIVSNFAFGLYNSVWSFAGVDEIIRSFVSATVIDLALVFVDRVLFEDIIGIGGRMPVYSYMLCWFFFVFCIAGIRMAYRLCVLFRHRLLQKVQKMRE